MFNDETAGTFEVAVGVGITGVDCELDGNDGGTAVYEIITMLGFPATVTVGTPAGTAVAGTMTGEAGKTVGDGKTTVTVFPATVTGVGLGGGGGIETTLTGVGDGATGAGDGATATGDGALTGDGATGTGDGALTGDGDGAAGAGDGDGDLTP